MNLCKTPHFHSSAQEGLAIRPALNVCAAQGGGSADSEASAWDPVSSSVTFQRNKPRRLSPPFLGQPECQSTSRHVRSTPMAIPIPGPTTDSFSIFVHNQRKTFNSRYGSSILSLQRGHPNRWNYHNSDGISSQPDPKSSSPLDPVRPGLQAEAHQEHAFHQIALVRPSSQ